MLHFDLSTLSSPPQAELFPAPGAEYFSNRGTGAFQRTLEKAESAGRQNTSGTEERSDASAEGRQAAAAGPREESDARGRVKSAETETRSETGEQAGQVQPSGEEREDLSHASAGEAAPDHDQAQLARLLLRLSPQERTELLQRLGLENLLQGEPGAEIRAVSGSRAGSVEGRRQAQRLLRALERLVDGLGKQAVAAALSQAKARAGSTGREKTAEPEPRKAPETEKPRKVEDAKAGTRKTRVAVLDLRKEQPQPAAMPQNAQKGAEGAERQTTFLYRAALQQGQTSASAPTPVRAGESQAAFEQRLVPEVVKHTGIILKDGGNGEIRLVLKPENLGSLRIRLALSESGLEGRIVVDNNSVKDLVESSLESLKNALRAEGYETANLQVSVGHRRNSGEQGQQLAQPEVLRGIGTDEFDKAVPLFADMKPEYELVNLFA